MNSRNCIKLFCRSVSTCCKILVICVCFVCFYTNTVERRKVVTLQGNLGDSYLAADKYNHRFVNKSSIPLCSKNLLDLRQYDYKRWARDSVGNNLIISSNGNVCQLAFYSTEQAVKCIDNLHYQVAQLEKIFRHNKKSLQKAKELHFVFIGDSRIRQQFLNILKLIPPYDWKQSNDIHMFHFQGDRIVTSKILNLRLSFYWCPLINDTVLNMIEQWTNMQTNPPFLTVIGIAAHHMLQANGADYLLYQRKLTKLGPILGQLSRISRVIWLNQYPTFDIYGHNSSHNTDVHSEKLETYNKVIRHVLRDYPEIRIWDSSNPLAEEYIRSCKLARRQDIGSAVTSYTDCGDYIHTGYVALSRATQLLMNDLCNYKIFYK